MGFWRELVRERREKGLEYVQLVVRRRGGNSPLNWDRAQVKPGLFGKCIGAGRVFGEWIVDVKLDDVEKWIARRSVQP